MTESGAGAQISNRGIGGDPVAQLASHLDLFANDLREALTAVIAQHEPELERAETAAERNAVIHQVQAAVGGSQDFRHKGKGLPQSSRAAAVENAAIDRHHQPFVRIEYERIGAIAAIENPAVFGHDRGRAGVGCVNVQPEAFALRDIGDGGDGIDAGG